MTTHHSMLRRCFQWDYTSPCIYMITLTLADRSKPLLGRVVVDSQGHNPEDVRAHLAPSALGEAVQTIWGDIPRFYPQIKPLYLQLMEEHLHGILHVQERLPKPLGSVIGAFKGDCTKVYRTICNTSDALFSRGFQDTILFRKGQLDRMFNYLKDNPRRLAVKRLFPNLFHINRNIPFGSGYLTGIGNMFLLQRPHFFQIQVSRRVSLVSPEFEKSKQALFQALSRQAVAVSPCISEGERGLARLVFESKAPLIALKNNCFPPFYKPSGAHFDACADGRLLLLAPPGFGYRPGHRALNRSEACVLNSIAQRICGEDAVPINYHGLVPNSLDLLVEQALQP